MNEKQIKMQKRTEKFYDSYNFYSPLKYGQRRYAFFKNIIPKEGKVLDVGSGMGRTSKLIHELNPILDIAAIDISEESLKKLPPYIKKKKASALNLPFDNNSFDLVYSVGCLHHTPDAQKGFKECSRVLKKGGGLVVAIYNKWNLYNIIYHITKHTPNCIKKWFKNGFIRDQFFTPHASFYSFWEIKKWFKNNNIKLIKYDSTGLWPPYFTKKFGSFVYYYGVKEAKRV